MNRRLFVTNVVALFCGGGLFRSRVPISLGLRNWQEMLICETPTVVEVNGIDLSEYVISVHINYDEGKLE